jgi:hypothetical protein
MATYLLNYSSDYQMLLNFCKSAFLLLKNGGHFVGLNLNPFQLSKDKHDIVKKYE